MPVMSKPGFLAKTNSGLKRLLSAEEVWNWVKETREQTPAKQDMLGAAPPSSSSPSSEHQLLCPGARESKEEFEGGEQRSSYTENKREAQKEQKIHSHKEIKDSASSGDESSPLSSLLSSSSSGGPLRVRSLPNSPATSQKSIGSFASLPEFRRTTAVCFNISEVSRSSSEIEEDLPFDSINCAGSLDLVGATCEFSIDVHKGTKAFPVNSQTHNVENNQRSYCVQSFNRNLGENVEDNQCISATFCVEPKNIGTKHDLTRQKWADSSNAPSHLDEGPCNNDTDLCREISSDEDDFSEPEEKSEAFSYSSDGLASSEDEKLLKNQYKTKEQASSQSHRGQHGSAETQLSTVVCSTFIHYKAKHSFDTHPDHCLSSVENHMLREKCGISKPGSFAPCSFTVTEDTLSEILSPVDEVLSYGSAELPPSVAAAGTENLLLPPPPPAFEIITWTSEEDFPPPSEYVGELQPDRNLAEDPSIRSEDLPSLSDDILFPVYKENISIQCDGGGNQDCLQRNSSQNSDKDQLNEDHESSVFSSKADENEFSVPLSSFGLGDRVLVCMSKPGVLKFKGRTSFACGYWAGVQLDSPTGNHNGTFRGVEYFKCDKNCGVLVNSEDISQILGDPESDLETRVEDDPFSDEESPNNAKQEQDKENEDKHSGDKKALMRSHEPSSDGNTAPKSAYTDVCLLEELNNNPFQVFGRLHDDILLPLSVSITVTSESGVQDQLQENVTETALVEEKFAQCGNNNTVGHYCQNNKPSWNVNDPSHEGATRDLEDISFDNSREIIISSNDVILGNGEDYTSHPVNWVDLLCHRLQNVTESKRMNTLESLVNRLSEDLIKEVVKDVQEFRKRHQCKTNLNQVEGQNSNTIWKKNEDNHPRTNLLEFSEQWKCALVAPQIFKVRPHDVKVVQSLVETAVEKLCGHPVRDAVDVPGYLINDQSCKAYQQIIYDLTTEVFKDVVIDHCGYAGTLEEASSLSSLQTNKEMKSLVLIEVRRLLNLDRTDLEMRQMLQTMFKYGNVRRDKVDCILIQELHKEEQQWVDYSSEQLTIKTRLAEEIFDLMLEDTMTVLKRISMS